MAVAEIEMQNGHFYFKEGNSKKNIVYGMQQAISFARKVAAGEKIGRKKFEFDDKFVREIHKKVAYGSGNEGQFRSVEGFEIAGIDLAPPYELPTKFYLYGRWLQKETDTLRNEEEDPIKTLETAAAAHHGIVMPPHHPFNNGNGRTARVVANAVLMANTYELRVHHKAIPPLPLLRSLDRKNDQYIEAVSKVTDTGDLSCLMMFMARRWVDTLDERHMDIFAVAPRPLNRGDRALLDNIEERSMKLKDFINQGTDLSICPDVQTKKNGSIYYPVPDYFSIDSLNHRI